MDTYQIPEATGASVSPGQLTGHNKGKRFSILEFGASPEAAPLQNTQAINSALQAASKVSGAVLVPKGTFYTYTILLQSNVTLCLEEGAVIAAAKTDICHSYAKQSGQGGNYEEPEINLYAGIQDHGHTYFANSLVYGADLENVMISGKGLFTGGRFDENGILEYVLQGGDPMEPSFRNARGHRGEWFGNKGIALVRCRNVVLEDFSVTIGGHFAIIAEGCENLYAHRLLVDTTRDAIDIDCCRNVTLRHTVCNSLTDDGICLKASFGAGIFKPLENVLIEDCTVSGYDAGSVYAGQYTRDKLIALDRCGPTGRVKFGTESTCGYHLVTIRRVNFQRSRGFCLEAVDCSSLTDVIFEDCTLDNVSSSPIFLRAGDRGRFPVTGNSSSAEFPASGENVRLDNKNWILPNHSDFSCYPARRYAPCYNRGKTVTVDGHSFFEIVDPENPVRCNPVNYTEKEGHFYPRVWKAPGDSAVSDTIVSSVDSVPSHSGSHGSYETDFSRELSPADLPLYANGVGCGELACLSGILIRNVKVTNADPRYPILLMGLTDSPIRNVILENVSVEYRGGLTMEHAVEQRQLNTEWKYSQFHAREHVQSLPWLVNTFFLKNEGLLPRADWDPENACWREDPYNVPELPEVYPEPSNWGILPAYGLFAKHVKGLTLKNVSLTCRVPDGRHVFVFDDSHGIRLENVEADCQQDREPVAVITDHYRRHTNRENVPEQPYFTTCVTDLEIAGTLKLHFGSQEEDTGKTSKKTPPLVKEVVIQAPAPGTPRDSLYPYPTAPCAESGYCYRVDTDAYPLPLTVHRPFFHPAVPGKLVPGQPYSLTLSLRNPASDVSEEKDDGIIYNEQTTRLNYGVRGRHIPLTLRCENMPSGGVFHPDTRTFSWTPALGQEGTHEIIFIVDDGIMPEKMTLKLTVEPAETGR